MSYLAHLLVLSTINSFCQQINLYNTDILFMTDNEDQSQIENPIRKVKDLAEEQNEHNLYAFTPKGK